MKAWRSIHVDFRSSRGFRWPYPGNVAVAPLPDGAEFSRGGACPEFEGDGLCLAKTWKGAASGSIPALCALEVVYDTEHVLGEDDDKVRVSQCAVVDVFDPPALIRDGWMADANLGYADLRSANLGYANLEHANLRYANLGHANLWSANLGHANLGHANLGHANLGYANLRYADLGYADLRYADLRFADLRSADLRSADLGSAVANECTVWPDGFDPQTAGVIL